MRTKKNEAIDLSRLINTDRQAAGYGVLCEFWELGHGSFLGHLATVQGTRYNSVDGDWARKCRPAFNIWQAHDGGECPLPEGFVVKTQDDGLELRVDQIGWESVKKYKVIGIYAGYQYPWGEK